MTPVFEVTIPSSTIGDGEPKKITCRPFLVKEHKILLMEQESNDEYEIYNVVKSVLTNCILSEDINVDELSTFDVQYIFLKLRAKSINEKIKMGYKCTQEVDNDAEGAPVGAKKKCGGLFKHTFEINELTVNFPEHAKYEIELDSRIGIKFKYPTFQDLRDSLKEDESTNINYSLIKKCIVCIYDHDSVYEDFTMKELVEFIDTLTAEQLNKLTNFFDEIPKLHYEIEFDCPKCHSKENLVLDSLSDFFVSV